MCDRNSKGINYIVIERGKTMSYVALLRGINAGGKN